MDLWNMDNNLCQGTTYFDQNQINHGLCQHRMLILQTDTTSNWYEALRSKKERYILGSLSLRYQYSLTCLSQQCQQVVFPLSDFPLHQSSVRLWKAFAYAKCCALKARECALPLAKTGRWFASFSKRYFFRKKVQKVKK